MKPEASRPVAQQEDVIIARICRRRPFDMAQDCRIPPPLARHDQGATKVRAALQSEAFDSAALKAAMDEVRAARSELEVQIQDVMREGATAMSPMDCVGWASKMGIQVRPASFENAA